MVNDAGFALSNATLVNVVPETDTRYAVGAVTLGPETWNVILPPLAGSAPNAVTLAVKFGPDVPGAG
jgi:hypothetical protein